MEIIIVYIRWKSINKKTELKVYLGDIIPRGVSSINNKQLSNHTWPGETKLPIGLQGAALKNLL